MPSALEQLQDMTVIVADTGDAAEIAKHKPVDCTTNPSLVLAALESPATADLIATEVSAAKAKGLDAVALCDTLTVAIGANLASLVPGRVSTEVDARLSFDAEASVRRAKEILADYSRRGVEKDRVLIKLASTWEGIKAAERLERDRINCNLTLLFSLEQAKACADAGVFLISPFVGRITDWFKEANGIEQYGPDDDPGVRSVREIYQYYKDHGIRTVVMGASFRNTDQVKALAGCDRLTISPKLLSELAADQSKLQRQLSDSTSSRTPPERLDEASFRWGLNANAMATEKLAQGIRSFDVDHKKLLTILSDKL